eukprot:scaffold29540_cov63-Phaeocystis_antarctica.AAC.2
MCCCTRRSLASLRERSARWFLEEASARKRSAIRVPATQRPGCHGTADTAGPRRMGTPRRAGWLALSHAGKRSKSQLLRGETRDRTTRVRRVENAALRISIEQPPFSPTHPLGDVGGCAKDVATYQHGAVVKFDSFARPPRSARVPLAANNPQCTPSSSSHPSQQRSAASLQRTATTRPAACSRRAPADLTAASGGWGATTRSAARSLAGPTIRRRPLGSARTMTNGCVPAVGCTQRRRQIGPMTDWALCPQWLPRRATACFSRARRASAARTQPARATADRAITTRSAERPRTARHGWTEPRRPRAAGCALAGSLAPTRGTSARSAAAAPTRTLRATSTRAPLSLACGLRSAGRPIRRPRQPGGWGGSCGRSRRPTPCGSRSRCRPTRSRRARSWPSCSPPHSWRSAPCARAGGRARRFGGWRRSWPWRWTRRVVQAGGWTRRATRAVPRPTTKGRRSWQGARRPGPRTALRSPTSSSCAPVYRAGCAGCRARTRKTRKSTL